MICREKMKINYIKMKCTNRHNYAAQLSRAKPGNPDSILYMRCDHDGYIVLFNGSLFLTKLLLL